MRIGTCRLVTLPAAAAPHAPDDLAVGVAVVDAVVEEGAHACVLFCVFGCEG